MEKAFLGGTKEIEISLLQNVYRYPVLEVDHMPGVI